MEEILKLQQQLAAIQSSTTKTKLADRNVIEIINLLKQKYGLELHFSTDGNEFVTPEQLDQMIIDCVQEHSKISISEMPNHLLMGQKKVEDRIDFVLEKSDVILVDGYLLSPEYLDRVFEEINEDLQLVDEISFSDISLKLAFSVNFVKSEISKRIGGVIEGVISDDKNGIMTTRYLRLFNAKVKGAALGQQGPCTMKQMARIILTDTSKLEIALRKLISEGQIDGEVQGGLYIPGRFLKAKSNIVKGKFSKDGYVEYDWIKSKFNVKDVEKFLKNEIEEELIFLESCAFSKEATHELKEEIEGSMETDGYADVFDFFPVAFEEEDIEKILYEELSMEDIIFENDTLLSKSKLEDCCKNLEPILLDSLKSIYSPQIKNESKKSKKKNFKKKKAPAAGVPVSRDDAITLLSKDKLIEYIVDDDVKDTFFDNLKPVLQERYSVLEEEMTKALNSKSSNVINDVTMRVKHLYTSLMMINESIKKLIDSDFDFNENHIEDLAISLAERFMDMAVYLICKKFTIDIDKNFLRDQDIAEATLPDFDKFSLRFFKEKIDLGAIIKNFNDDLKEYYLELNERVQARNLVKLCDFLQDNSSAMSLPMVNLSKSTQKNYVHAQKFFLKQKAKDLTKPSEVISYAVASILLENGVTTWPIHYTKPVNLILQWNLPLLEFVRNKVGDDVIESLEDFLDISKKGDTDSKEVRMMMKNIKKLI